MYEPEYLRDPRVLGLIDQHGRAIGEQHEAEPGIQPPASENVQ
jgi:hypothetical protein